MAASERTAGLIVVGNEILSGKVVDTNAPFLARELVEFGLALPRQFKIGPTADKRLMRQLLRPRLGTRLARRPKRGFEIPVDRWFREPATDALRTQLKRGSLVRDLGFSAQAIEELTNRHLSGEDVGRKLFALAALERWAQRFAARQPYS